jgi:hypothetical protein
VNIPRILGTALILLGVYILWQRPTYSSQRNVVEIGDFKASVDEVKAIPPWWGVAGVGAGVVLLLVAGRKRGPIPPTD